jgi:hypothetical protein
VPGNHDCDAQSGSFAPFARRFPLPDPLTIIDVAPRLRLALANLYHDCSGVEESTGIWSEDLDAALRQAATEANTDGCALLLVLHTWVLSEQTLPSGLVKNVEHLIDTLSNYPAIAAAFTGHRHLNRIRMYRDFLVVDTSCLIGFPLGFRLIELADDGTFSTTFHTLPLPDLSAASYARSTPQENERWQGEIHDRETQILLPRLQAIWT